MPMTDNTDSVLDQIHKHLQMGDRDYAFLVACTWIESQFSAANLSLIDDLLKRIDPSVVGGFISSGILRASYRSRDQLPAYQTLLQKTKIFLDRTDQDSVHRLRGLF